MLRASYACSPGCGLDLAETIIVSEGWGVDMAVLRHFMPEDAESIRENLYPDMTIGEIADLIREWNACLYENRYFEMFAVLSEGGIVGYASLREHSPSVVSAGIEIYRKDRNMGYGTQAVNALIDLAVQKGYRILLDQVRADNQASIRLHEKLGFESDQYVYLNRKGIETLLYIKPL